MKDSPSDHRTIFSHEKETDAAGGQLGRVGSLTLLSVGMVLPTLLVLFYFIWTEGWSPHSQQTAIALSKAAQFSLPLLWWLFFGPKGMLALGAYRGNRLAWAGIAGQPGQVSSARLWRSIGEGLAFGVAASAVIAGGYVLLEANSPLAGKAGQQIAAFLARSGISTLWQYAVVSLGYSIIHAGLEEIYWRWFIFGGLCRFLSPWLALVAGSLAFTSHHVIILGVYLGWLSWGQAVGTLGVLVGGAYWAWLFWRTSSLLAPWLSHAVVDLAIFWVGFQLVGPYLSW
ncbi:MAG: CPBP family intramembrane metalloprotease [Thermoguttaceae bacterium]|nr:CPBP family intramembrane metalloprotease [Thermoguttaceae bacterium]MDW8079433.1 CPBP family intramembrane glutamic endopeptidase [Thermoguttaceae bacterium]